MKSYTYLAQSNKNFGYVPANPSRDFFQILFQYIVWDVWTSRTNYSTVTNLYYKHVSRTTSFLSADTLIKDLVWLHWIPPRILFQCWCNKTRIRELQWLHLGTHNQPLIILLCFVHTTLLITNIGGVTDMLFCPLKSGDYLSNTFF